MALNDYRYMLGSDAAGAKSNGPVKITVVEPGPLVAALRIESDAPGCKKLTREVRVVDGLDRVDITNTVDKMAVREKEGVHFGFAFNVPDGVMRMGHPPGRSYARRSISSPARARTGSPCSAGWTSPMRAAG